MELIIISGFLGSGKTSILLTLAKAFAGQGCKVAIIENEVSKDGVDGKQLRAEGLDVREIYAGFEIADLVAVNKSDLVSAEQLQDLERRVREVNPEVDLICEESFQGLKSMLGGR